MLLCQYTESSGLFSSVWSSLYKTVDPEAGSKNMADSDLISKMEDVGSGSVLAKMLTCWLPPLLAQLLANMR